MLLSFPFTVNFNLYEYPAKTKLKQLRYTCSETFTIQHCLKVIDRSLEVRVFIRNQHRLNIDLQSENYAVDDKFQCNIVYFSLIQDIKVLHCGRIVIRSGFQFGTK